MGSWDSTCAVSHLPIEWDDPIRFFFLRPDEFEDRDHGWIPLTLPIKGVYDGYGSVKNFEPTNLTKLQAQVLAKFACKIDEDKISGFPRMDGRDATYPTDLMAVACACERGWLNLTIPLFMDKEEPPETFPVKPWMVREEVYQAMLKQDPPGLAIGRSRIERWLHGSIESKKRGPAMWLKQSIETWKHLQEPRSETSDPEGKQLLREVHEALSAAAESTLGNLKNREIQFLFGNATTHAAEFTALLEFTDDDWEALDREVTDHHVFCSTMKELRRAFHPATYTDQVDPDSDPTAANELLAHLILHNWGPAMRAKYEQRRED